MTNNRLYKMKIVSSSLCNLCHSSIETPRHLFCECEVAKSLWLDFAFWWENLTNHKFVRNPKTIMFGTNTDNSNLLLNLCIIIIKRVIYLCRFKNLKPHLNYFKAIVRTNFHAEKNFAVENNTMHSFIDKWENVDEEALV